MSEPLISIVDDDPSLRDALVGLVRSLGLRASGHASADAYLATGEAKGAACIVTDVQMAGLSGIEFTRRLGEVGCTAPVIMITARADPELAAQARAVGAHALLRKPFDTEALIDCLNSALMRS